MWPRGCSAIGPSGHFAAIDSLDNGLVDEGTLVVASVRTNRTDHHGATSKSVDTSETSKER
jgi:hypothetical protein